MNKGVFKILGQLQVLNALCILVSLTRELVSELVLYIVDRNSQTWLARAIYNTHATNCKKPNRGFPIFVYMVTGVQSMSYFSLAYSQVQTERSACEPCCCTLYNVGKDPMSNFRSQRQSEGQHRPTAIRHGRRQDDINSLFQTGRTFELRPNVNFQACGSADVDEGAKENKAVVSVRRGRERTNILSSQKLLGKRDTRRPTTSSKAVEHEPTIVVNNNNRPEPKPNVRPTYLPEPFPRSKSGYDRPNTIVTLSSLKHMSVSTKSSALPIDKRTKKTQTVGKTRNKTMSYTRPNSYGKVSNPGRPDIGQEQGSSHQQGAQGGSSTESNTPQRHGSYTLITPNSIKRNKVLTQASKEATDYANYKESRRVNYVKTAPQAVGGIKSEEEIRKQRERDAQNKKYEMIMKRRKWEAEKKEREEAEYREKKERAREQARRNEQRKIERQDIWTEDHRRTNEAFLRRLEQQQK